MVRTVIKVKHEHRKLEYLRVQNDIPEHKLMFAYEAFRHENLISFLRDDIEKLLVKSHWWKKGQSLSLSTLHVRVLLLTINGEFGYKALLANGAFDCVVAKVLLEACEQLLFTQELFAFSAVLLDLKKQGVFKNLAELLSYA